MTAVMANPAYVWKVRVARVKGPLRTSSGAFFGGEWRTLRSSTMPVRLAWRLELLAW